VRRRGRIRSRVAVFICQSTIHDLDAAPLHAAAAS
jgi:hypothetical protein